MHVKMLWKIGPYPLNNDLSSTPISEQNRQVKPVVTKNWWFRGFSLLKILNFVMKKVFAKYFCRNHINKMAIFVNSES